MVLVAIAAALAVLSAGPASAAPVDPEPVPPVLPPPVSDTDGPTVAEAARLVPAWAVPAGTVSGDALYFAGAVYHAETRVGGADRVGLVRRDTGTGDRLPFAAKAVPGFDIATPVTDGDSVLTITPGDGVVRAYRPDGRPRWTATIPGDQRASWVLATGGLVLAAAEFRCGHHEGDVCERTVLHAFRAGTGRRTWTREIAGGSPVAVAAGDRIAVRTRQDDDALYGDDVVEPGEEPPSFVDDSPSLVTVLTRTGERVWRKAVADGGDLAADARTVHVAGERFCAYRARDGRRLWCAPKGHRHHDVTVADGRVYAGVDDLTVPDDHRVAAFDARTGRRLWTAPGAYPYGPITVGNGVVWLQSNTDMPVTVLLGLRADDGRELRRLPLGEYSSGGVALGVGRVFLLRGGDTVAAFR
ncbi:MULTISPECIES: outer membrane protein assembly factor BamB family protein [Catenuloplanes]|uniref:Outer membrane protein assembly factor BamB n=1 Tax=Catenuloplanes niger TaxID=587534 RepID=A0AAE3ZKP3_9ACTN|nr:PQQ-binding-like beta-propeller repeat protein [Catenuloplanes niger]MDR7321693.1 outer membrane protein assembly factor BamB [Catenuloplanes niger]